MISFSAFKIHKFKMGCRMKYDCQDSLKIEQIKNLFVQGYDYYYRIFNIDCIHIARILISVVYEKKIPVFELNHFLAK